MISYNKLIINENEKTLILIPKKILNQYNRHMEYLYIAIGSGTGGLLRYLLSKWTHSLSETSFPVGTL
ncbi:MAG: hypothetical protein RBT69_07345, partial [Spirochaetia bacterium]|nr:hypothetical protein [Spirochaetia bacterium]